MTHTAAALDQSVTIQHRMDSALGRNGNAGEPANQAFADFSSTPAGVLALHIQDVVLDLERKLVGIALGTPACVSEPLHPPFLIRIEDLVAVLAGDPHLPENSPHRLAGEPQTAFVR